jgi:hypothetical protein
MQTWPPHILSPVEISLHSSPVTPALLFQAALFMSGRWTLLPAPLASEAAGRDFWEVSKTTQPGVFTLV